MGCSLSIIGQVENIPVKFLVDTGASITIVSKRFYDKYLYKLQLEQVDFDFRQADG
jgi:predicted aspartyl protease